MSAESATTEVAAVAEDSAQEPKWSRANRLRREAKDRLGVDGLKQLPGKVRSALRREDLTAESPPAHVSHVLWAVRQVSKFEGATEAPVAQQRRAAKAPRAGSDRPRTRSGGVGIGYLKARKKAAQRAVDKGFVDESALPFTVSVWLGDSLKENLSQADRKEALAAFELIASMGRKPEAELLIAFFKGFVPPGLEDLENAETLEGEALKVFNRSLFRANLAMRAFGLATRFANDATVWAIWDGLSEELQGFLAKPWDLLLQAANEPDNEQLVEQIETHRKEMDTIVLPKRSRPPRRKS